MSRNILVSISGGRSSHLMAFKMLQDPPYQNDNLLLAFANSGKEREETLEFVRRCDTELGFNSVWVEADVNPNYRVGTGYRIVGYETASRNGEPFEAMIQKYGIPNKSFPHCTRELKLAPLRAYARNYFGSDFFYTAIGIRVDEARRIKITNDKIYPLVEWAVTAHKVRRFWQSMPFDLNLKDYEGNCDLCWKKSKRKILTLLTEKPELAKWWAEMELKYSKLDFADRRADVNPDGTYFGRGNTPIDEFIKLASQPFDRAYDPYRRTAEMDDEEPCACMIQEEIDF